MLVCVREKERQCLFHRGLGVGCEELGGGDGWWSVVGGEWMSQADDNAA